MATALDVARYFVLKGNGERSMTQLKVIKLAYYAQGWHLGLYGVPLFEDLIEAWDLGPVVLGIRCQFRQYGANPIPVTERPSEDLIQDQQTVQFLEIIWNRFNRHTAGQLVDMTHKEQPWIEAYNRTEDKHIISQEAMKAYFVSCLNQIKPYVALASLDSATEWALEDFENVVNQVCEPEDVSNLNFSEQFLQSSDSLAEKLVSQTEQLESDVLLASLAQSLASYRD